MKKVGVLFIITLSFNACLLEKNIELYPIIEDGKMGFIDQRGKIRIPANYEPCEEGDYTNAFFCDNLFSSSNCVIVKIDEKFGALNSKGEIQLEAVFESMESFGGSKFIAKLGAKYGMINCNNDTLLPFIFDSPILRPYGIFANKIDGQKVLYFAHSGKTIDIPYEQVGYFSDNQAIVKSKNSRYGIIDTTGKLIIDTLYVSIQRANGIIAVETYTGDWKFIKHPCKELLNEEFHDIECLFNGMCIVQKYKYGVIDTANNTIIPFIYEYLEFEFGDTDDLIFSCGEHWVESIELWEMRTGVINIKGDTLLDCNYYDLFLFDGIAECMNDAGKSGVFNVNENKLLLPFNFTEIYYDVEGLTIVFFEDNEGEEYFGYVNSKNRIIWSNDPWFLEVKLMNIVIVESSKNL